jgi:hypothetical protein
METKINVTVWKGYYMAKNTIWGTFIEPVAEFKYLPTNRTSQF